MSMFEGSYNSRIKENHVFICEHPVAESLGICSTTRKSFYDNYNKMIKGIREIYPAAPSGFSQGYTILDLFGLIDGHYEYYDKTRESWIEKKVNALYMFYLISIYELYMTNSLPKPKSSYEQEFRDFRNIKASTQKGVFFYYNSSEISWLGVPQEKNSPITVKVFLQSYQKSDNTRTVAHKGAMNFVSTPRTVTGKKYAFRQTNDHQSGGSANMGTYFPTQTGGDDNVVNTVAAELEMTYNKNTGRMEAGNKTTLAKVISPIGPANVDNVVIKFDQPYNASDFFDPLGGNFNGQYTSGEAIILSSENRDPAMLGPNFIDCKDKSKMEKVVVINRSNNSFEAGETVKLTSIDGFWIPEPFVGSTGPKAPRFGEWSFCKMIANTDTYFKDNRFYTDSSVSQSYASKYELEARTLFYYNQFYNSDFNKKYATTIRDNGSYTQSDGLKNSSFIPSKRYYITTVYDQFSKEHGGWSNNSVIGKTNMALSGKGTDVFFDPDCPFFWGPLFGDGYSAIRFNDNIRNYIDSNGTQEPSGYLYASGYINAEEGVSENWPLAGDTDVGDLPAECVGKILDPRQIIAFYNTLGTTQKLPHNQYYQPTHYGSVPSSLNRLLFVPMTAEFAAHNDEWAQDPYLASTAGSARYFYTNVRDYFSDAYGINSDGEHYFGYMFDRVHTLFGASRSNFIPTIGIDEDQTTGFSIFLQGCDLIYDATLNANSELRGNQNTVAYDCFIKNEPTSVPLGAPRYFRGGGDYLGGNCVGIISAQNKITKKGGGDINIAVGHINIGLPSEKQATGGGAFQSFFDGMTLHFFNNGSNVRNIENLMWGSTSDSIDSFGTTVLHVRIFDAWPEQQTIFDPRFFAVLHFNPGLLGSGDGDDSKEDVDFDEPDLPVDSYVSYNTEFNYRKNTVRRGQLLTGGGFKYTKRIFGLNPNQGERLIYEPGAGFKNGDVIEGGNNVKVTVGTVNEQGGITSFIFTIDTDEETNTKFLSNGEYTIDDFSEPDEQGIRIIPLTLKSPTEGARSAVVWFYSLIVKEKDGLDKPPTEHTSGATKLTYASNGAGYINKTKETTVNLVSNDTGQYDIFLHFHNDITHTSMLEHGADQVIGFGQYLDVSIT